MTLGVTMGTIAVVFVTPLLHSVPLAKGVFVIHWFRPSLPWGLCVQG